jgi:hypothetical protein
MTVLLVALLFVVLPVLTPVALRLLATPFPRLLVPAWPFAALLACLALPAPRGLGAVLFCTPYAALCGWVTVCGVGRALRARGDLVREFAAVMATSSLSVAAVALLSERAGYQLFGFDLVTLRLTVLHFHVAGFAAALLAGLANLAVRSRLSRLGAVSVPAGTALVGAGFLIGNWVELAGAVVLAAGLLATSWCVLWHVAHVDTEGGQLLLISSLATPMTMALAVWWATGEATGLPHLTLTETAATHGLANVLAVGLCGVLGWTTTAREQL